MDTFGSMKGRVKDWTREQQPDALVGDAVNDAIENLGNAILLASLSRMVQGPVQNLTLHAGDERATLVSIPDPTAPPILTLVATGSPAPIGRVTNVVYTLVTESGSETLPSPVSWLVVGEGNSVQCAPPDPVPGAVGWNCYMGNGDIDESLYRRQNDAILLFSAPCIENFNGADAAGDVFPPAVNSTADNITYIDSLEVQNQDGTWTRWNSGEIYGQLFRRMNMQIANSSTFTQYAWDIVNERQIEVRPKIGIGATFHPRYFYVAKPRRLAYDGATIPFQSYSGATAFIRYFALSLISLSEHEYDASARWEQKANAERQLIVLVVNNQNVARVKTITPYMY